MLNRRSLMKWFSVGAASTVVPEVHARLIEVPGVQLVSRFPDGHKPTHFLDRLKWNPFEAIWLKFWQIENNPSWSSGPGPLWHILQRDPTPEDKAVAAGVIMWLGTNCGHCFLEETLRASGYKITYDESLPLAKEIKQVQYGSVWPAQPNAEVTIMRRGRLITLRSGEYPELGLTGGGN